MRMHLLFGSLFILAASQTVAAMPTNQSSGPFKVAVDSFGQKAVNERIVLVSSQDKPVPPPRPGERPVPPPRPGESSPPLPPLPDERDVAPMIQAPEAPTAQQAPGRPMSMQVPAQRAPILNPEQQKAAEERAQARKARSKRDFPLKAVEITPEQRAAFKRIEDRAGKGPPGGAPVRNF